MEQVKKRSDDFKSKIIYQIYPLSFCDSNNDGYGDIQGIISKLDYLKDLGVQIIWLSPIYKSPMFDNGYDISDYYSINPIFGTMEDFDCLINEAKKRDIRIVMDLVINHTSDQHHFFQDALKDKESKYRDYYYFRKANKRKYPNNWNSAFTGPAWEKVPNEDGMFYLHLYTKQQPDLNFHNEEVIKEVENVMKFYLDKGVYGFRCDVINQIYKTSLKNGKFRILNRGGEHYINQDGTHKVLRRFYDDLLSKYDTFLVGETSNITTDEANKYIRNHELDTMFEFEHAMCDGVKWFPIIKRKFKMKNLLKPIYLWQNNVDWVSVYLENHDQRRSVTRFGDTKKYHKESAKALAVLLFMLKGSTYVYQGQEIGMTDYTDNTKEEMDDCATKYALQTAKKLFFFIPKRKLFQILNSMYNRDHARSPMQWDCSVNAGFNKGTKPWLKVNKNYLNGINVLQEKNDPNSILNFYKKLVSLKTNSEVIKKGDIKVIFLSNKYTEFERCLNDKRIRVLINLTKKKVKYSIANINKEKILISSVETYDDKYLLPYQAIVYEV